MKNRRSSFHIRFKLLIDIIVIGVLLLPGYSLAAGFTDGGSADPGPLFLPLVLKNACFDGIPPDPTRIDPNPPADYLQYDRVHFDVYQQMIHCRLVTVAIGKDFGTPDSQTRAILKDHIFETWNVFWEEYGGFPYPSYTIVIGNNLPYDVTKGSGEGGTGWETSYDPALTNYQYYAHGIYHAWNGNAFRQDTDARWFMEGVTEYYGFRQSRNTFYVQGLRYAYQQYIAARTAGHDVALSTITGANLDPYQLHYWKGALVAHLLDRELAATGHHLGQVARAVYQTYGVETMGAPTDAQFLAILQQVSGKSFTDFYDQYIGGTAPLPLDGQNFEWVEH